jgi:NAD(P)-dependent dehydrogenase (short-subunit alcohol dehydrogenase family)
VIVTRSRNGGEQVRQQIAAYVGADRVEVLTADLASQSDLHLLGERFAARHTTLHLLINNAGAHYRARTVNAHGVEMHIVVDYLAAFTLTNLLLDRLRAGAPSRVINVVSAAMADTRMVKIRRRPRPVPFDPAHLDDLRHLTPAAGFQPFTAYATAKLLTLMSGYFLAERLRNTGITINAVHPGLVATGIANDITPPLIKPFLGLIRPFLLTPEQGAQAALYLATAPEMIGVTGRYFNRTTESRSPHVSYNVELQRRIWNLSVAHTAQPAPHDRTE